MAEVSAASADLSALANDLAAASGGRGVFITAQEIIRTAAVRVRDEAQTRAPVKSGRLKESITVRFTGPLSAVIGPQVPYGVYQEFGTGERGEFPSGAYEIKPKKIGGLLAFKVNGKTVYARKVRHPGIKARPFMRPALVATLGDELIKKLADAGVAAITKGPNA